MTAIAHEVAEQRFTATPGGVLTYELLPGRAVFTHTVVPHELRGQGIAAALVLAGLQWARERGLKVVPQCSYVHTYLQRHPEWQDLQA